MIKQNMPMTKKETFIIKSYSIGIPILVSVGLWIMIIIAIRALF